MRTRKSPIGIFDSGIGGLTVLRAVERLLPGEDIIYFCDAARLPYGNKSPQEIIRNTMECVSFLNMLGIKMLVLACHTASAHLSLNQSVGMISVTCQVLMDSMEKKRVALLGTLSTIASGVYQNVLKQKLTLFPVACPLFVPLVEERLFDHELADRIVLHYLEPLRETEIDAVLLACTHYPLLRGAIQRVLGSALTIIDPATAVAEEVKRRLAKEELLSEKKRGEVRFYTTADCERFFSLATEILNQKIDRTSITQIGLLTESKTM